MRMPFVIVLVALALTAGFVGGMAVPRSSTEGKALTPYERGQLIAQCYQAAGTSISGSSAAFYANPGPPLNQAITTLLKNCTDEIQKLP